MHMLQHEHVMWESKYVCFVCEFEYVFFCARVSVYACVCTYIYSKHFILTSPQAAKGCSVCLCVCVCVCVCVCLCVCALLCKWNSFVKTNCFLKAKTTVCISQLNRRQCN